MSSTTRGLKRSGGAAARIVEIVRRTKRVSFVTRVLVANIDGHGPQRVLPDPVGPAR